MPERVLVVEDEPDLARALVYNLERGGYTVASAGSGEAALALAAADPPPDLVLLDVMLPDLSGIEVCRQLRSAPRTASVPVLILSARTDEIDRVLGFEAGADDYVPKPFSPRELMLRVKAVLRRRQPIAPDTRQLRLGDLHVDFDAHKVWVAGREVALTALEFRLLRSLATRRGTVMSRSDLLSSAWGIEADITTRTVDTHVKRLREKLAEAAPLVETVRGVGYRFTAVAAGP